MSSREPRRLFTRKTPTLTLSWMEPMGLGREKMLSKKCLCGSATLQHGCPLTPFTVPVLCGLNRGDTEHGGTHLQKVDERAFTWTNLRDRCPASLVNAVRSLRTHGCIMSRARGSIQEKEKQIARTEGGAGCTPVESAFKMHESTRIEWPQIQCIIVQLCLRGWIACQEDLESSV
jgi:hypothetical protein